MKILVLNCGSSSIKYQLVFMNGMKEEEVDVLASGIIERIGLGNSKIAYEPTGRDKIKSVQDIDNHTQGVDLILHTLTDAKIGVLKNLDEIGAIGHRIVHGGDKFSASVVVTDEVVQNIVDCIDLAPLHNPAHLKGIYAVQKLLPTVPQVAVFDTAFHQTMPDFSFMYAIPYEFYINHKIRRYGFHGTSHYYVSKKCAEVMGKNYEDLKIITCHLGNGASVAAVKNGKSVDTSMGLTPNEGLMMGTRTGDLDLGALLLIMEKENLNKDQLNDLINKKSGVLGVSQLSSDMRDIEEAAWQKGDYKANLALKMYFYRIKKYIGAYAAAMGGVDAIVFTGGIGERGPETREFVCTDMEYMGVEFDKEVNFGKKVKEPLEISKKGSKVKVFAIPTNEELVIAQDTFRLVSTK
jgi:acetate kinase